MRIMGTLVEEMEMGNIEVSVRDMKTGNKGKHFFQSLDTYISTGWLF
jgi:hypothetical protein